MSLIQDELDVICNNSTIKCNLRDTLLLIEAFFYKSQQIKGVMFEGKILTIFQYILIEMWDKWQTPKLTLVR